MNEQPNFVPLQAPSPSAPSPCQSGKALLAITMLVFGLAAGGAGGYYVARTHPALAQSAAPATSQQLVNRQAASQALANLSDQGQANFGAGNGSRSLTQEGPNLLSTSKADQVPSGYHDVVFEITGSGPMVNLVYQTSGTGDNNHVVGVDHPQAPWRHELLVPLDTDFFQIQATADSVPPRIGCRITVDDQIVAEHSNGDCSYFRPAQ
jgi:Mycobacterium membrane protein